MGVTAVEHRRDDVNQILAALKETLSELGHK